MGQILHGCATTTGALRPCNTTLIAAINGFIWIRGGRGREKIASIQFFVTKKLERLVSIFNAQVSEMYVGRKLRQHEIFKLHKIIYRLQAGIDRAFKNKSRVSNEIAECHGVSVCVVHGQRTDRLGVIEIKGPSNERLQVTDAERTLVDISVRPVYAGGVKEVLKAYRQAKESISIKKLVEMLRQMDYVYPYHQVIGFYLENADFYSKSELQLLAEIPMEFDFYLDYKMTETKYSKKWRLHKGVRFFV